MVVAMLTKGQENADRQDENRENATASKFFYLPEPGTPNRYDAYLCGAMGSKYHSKSPT